MAQRSSSQRSVEGGQGERLRNRRGGELGLRLKGFEALCWLILLYWVDASEARLLHSIASEGIPTRSLKLPKTKATNVAG